MCLVLAGLILLPWASLAAAWAWSGQFWLGVTGMAAAVYLDWMVLVSIGRYMDDRGR